MHRPLKRYEALIQQASGDWPRWAVLPALPRNIGGQAREQGRSEGDVARPRVGGSWREKLPVIAVAAGPRPPRTSIKLLTYKLQFSTSISLQPAPRSTAGCIAVFICGRVGREQQQRLERDQHGGCSTSTAARCTGQSPVCLLCRLLWWAQYAESSPE